MENKTFEFTPVDPVVDKIKAIKLIRYFSEVAFGITAGLKESKDFIDAYTTQRDKELELKRVQIRKDVIALLKHIPVMLRREFLFGVANNHLSNKDGYGFDPYDDVYREYLPE